MEINAKLQFIREAFENCQSKLLQRAKLVDLSFHSQSLFPLYCLIIQTDEANEIKLAAKEITSTAMANTESEGLRFLKQAGTSVPNFYEHVVFNGKNVLFMEFIQGSGRKDVDTLIQDLKKLYQNTHSHFGWARENFIGHLEQPNRWHTRFSEFWWEDRILPQFRLAPR